MMKLIAVATLITTTVAASSTYNGSRYKLLYKSKSAKKSSRSKSAKAKRDKSSSSSDDDAHSDNTVVMNRPPASSKSSKPIVNSSIVLDPPSSYPSITSVLPSMMPSMSLLMTFEDTHSPTVFTTTTHHYPIFSPHVTSADSDESAQPSFAPIVNHHLFGHNNDSRNHHDGSSSPSFHEIIQSSHAPTTTIQIQMDSSPPTNMPSVAAPSADPSSSSSPLTGGLFGPYGQDLDTTAIPTTLSTDLEDTVTLNEPTISTNMPTADSSNSGSGGLFSFNVTLSSYTSAPPTFSPTLSFTPSSPLTNTPTTPKASNLINIEQPSSQTTSGSGVQGAASLMVILACIMAILGTLYGVFQTMKKDNEESIIMTDDYGAQLARAAEFDADAIGGVNDVEGGGGVDGHLQLVTD